MDVHRNHTGIYQCHVGNGIGITSISTCYLDVFCKSINSKVRVDGMPTPYQIAWVSSTLCYRALPKKKNLRKVFLFFSCKFCLICNHTHSLCSFLFHWKFSAEFKLLNLKNLSCQPKLHFANIARVKIVGMLPIISNKSLCSLKEREKKPLAVNKIVAFFPVVVQLNHRTSLIVKILFRRKITKNGVYSPLLMTCSWRWSPNHFRCRVLGKITFPKYQISSNVF